MLKDVNLFGGWGLLSAPGPLTIASYSLPEVRGNQIRYGWRDGRWIVFLCRCLQNFLYLGIYRLMLLTLAGKIQEPHLGSRLAPLCTYNEYLLWMIVRVCSMWSQWPPQIVFHNIMRQFANRWSIRNTCGNASQARRGPNQTMSVA